MVLTFMFSGCAVQRAMGLNHKLYKRSGRRHHDVTHRYVDYHFEAGILSITIVTASQTHKSSGETEA